MSLEIGHLKLWIRNLLGRPLPNYLFTFFFFLKHRITPWVAVPGLFILASQSWMTQVLVHGMVLPLLIFCKYQTCLRSYRPQTKFFAMWSMATFAFLFYIYQFHVVGILHWPKAVSPMENLCLMGNFFFFFTKLALCCSIFYSRSMVPNSI